MCLGTLQSQERGVVTVVQRSLGVARSVQKVRVCIIAQTGLLVEQLIQQRESIDIVPLRFRIWSFRGINDIMQLLDLATIKKRHDKGNQYQE